MDIGSEGVCLLKSLLPVIGAPAMPEMAEHLSAHGKQ